LTDIQGGRSIDKPGGRVGLLLGSLFDFLYALGAACHCNRCRWDFHQINYCVILDFSDFYDYSLVELISYYAL